MELKKAFYHTITVTAAITAAAAPALMLLAAFFKGPWVCPVIFGLAIALGLACATGIAMAIRARNYFYDHKLLCIGFGPVTVCGQVNSIEENGDGDNSLNLLVDPLTDITTLKDFRDESKPEFKEARRLILPSSKESEDLHKLGFIFNEKLAADVVVDEKKLANPVIAEKLATEGQVPLMHCEIQGTAVDDYTDEVIGMLTALGITAAAIAVLAAFCSYPIVAIIIAVLTAILFFFKVFPKHERIEKGVLWKKGKTNLAEALPEAILGGVPTSGGYTINVGDHVVLMGIHVCDTGHWNDEGNPGCWNEIHPVIAITKLPPGVGRKEPNENTPATPGMFATKEFHSCNDYLKALGDFVSSSPSPHLIAGKSVPLEHDSIG
jgi:hypothetical protein